MLRSYSPSLRTCTAPTTSMQYVTTSQVVPSYPNVQIPSVQGFVPDFVDVLSFNLLKDKVGSLARDFECLRDDIKDLRRPDATLEDIRTEMSCSMREVQNQLKSDLQREVTRINKLESSCSDFQDRIVQDMTLLTDRVSGLARDLLFAKDNTPNAGVDDFKKSYVVDPDVSSLKAQIAAIENMVRENLTKLSDDLGDHKSAQDNLHKSTRELIAQERSLREKMHGGAGERLQELERRLRDSALDSKEKVSATTVEALERKVLGELAAHKSDHDAKHSKVAGDLNRWYEEHKRLGDDHKRKSDGFSDMLHKVNQDHHQRHSETQGSFLEQIQAVEKRLRDAMSNHASTHDTKHTTLANTIAALERKLQDTSAPNTDWRLKQPLQDPPAGQNVDEFKSLIEKHTTFTKGSLDDHKGDLRKALQDMDADIRRAIAAMSEDLRKQVRTYIEQERQDRENMDKGLAERLEDVDRKMKDVLAPLSADLAALERKFREDLQGIDRVHQGKSSDLRDLLQKGFGDHGTRFNELREIIAAVSAEEKRARDDHQKGMAITLGELERKLRQEWVDGTDKHKSNISDNFSQEREARERTHLTMGDRIGALERSLETYQKLADTRVADLRDLVADAVKNQGSRTQDLFKREREYMTSQLEGLGRALDGFNRALMQQREEVRNLGIRFLSEVRNHTHTMQQTQPQTQAVAAVPVATVASVAASPVATRVETRAASPMSMRAASPLPAARYSSPRASRQYSYVMPQAVSESIVAPTVAAWPAATESIVAPTISTTFQGASTPPVQMTETIVAPSVSAWQPSVQVTEAVVAQSVPVTTQVVSGPAQTLPSSSSYMISPAAEVAQIFQPPSFQAVTSPVAASGYEIRRDSFDFGAVDYSMADESLFPGFGNSATAPSSPSASVRKSLLWGGLGSREKFG